MNQEDHGVTRRQLTKDGSIVMSFSVVSTFFPKTFFKDDNFCPYKDDSISLGVIRKGTYMARFSGGKS